MRFFIGLHHPGDAQHFAQSFISVNTIRKRRSGFAKGNAWIMDSGAFSIISTHGDYPHPPNEYAAEIKRWSGEGNLLAAVSQDYMCEQWMLAKTGLTIEAHQRLTIDRYDALLCCDTGGVHIMPVLQGYDPADYVRHIEMYSGRLKPGMWVGVGSVCKRNGNPAAIENVLLAIKTARPDLQLHGFGVKFTSLKSGLVYDLLYSADSMAWSYAARISGRNGNSWHEAERYRRRVESQPRQASLIGFF